MKLYQGDCMEIMKQFPDKSVDMILADMPYGTTKNKWDTEINLQELWKHYNRIIKDRGCIALFAQTPFDKVLACSNLGMLKYEWIWHKTMPTGRLNCNFAPMKCHENILVFAKAAACRVKDTGSAMRYFPQFAEGKPYTAYHASKRKSTNYDTKWEREVLTVNTGTRYPRDVITFKHDKEKHHPTQKPVALLEYLIKTYTEPGDVVLDSFMGSGSTGVACENTGREFIGIELDSHYFGVAETRIKDAMERR